MKFKGILVPLILWIFTVLPLTAQFTVGGFIDIHVAGLNVKPAGSGEEYSSYLGFGLGGMITYPLKNGFAIQGEPSILQKGGKVTEDDETYTLKLLYFDIPVFLRYDIVPGNYKSFLPYVILGPYLGFRASAKVALPNGGMQDAGDEFSVVDLGLGFGGGVEMPYNYMVFFGEIRYVAGLLDINKESGESKVRNRGLQVLFGIKVPIKER
jgi:hypothetical protein